MQTGAYCSPMEIITTRDRKICLEVETKAMLCKLLVVVQKISIFDRKLNLILNQNHKSGIMFILFSEILATDPFYNFTFETGDLLA